MLVSRTGCCFLCINVTKVFLQFARRTITQALHKFISLITILFVSIASISYFIAILPLLTSAAPRAILPQAVLVTRTNARQSTMPRSGDRSCGTMALRRRIRIPLLPLRPWTEKRGHITTNIMTGRSRDCNHGVVSTLTAQSLIFTYRNRISPLLFLISVH